jgi:hypothetical protein
MNSHLEELEALLFDWEAGTVDATGVERVREILRSDEEARALFNQQQMLSAALKLEGDAGLGLPNVKELLGNESVPPTSVKVATGSTFRVGFWVATAATLLICVLAGRLLYLEFGGEVKTQEEIAATDNATYRDETKEATSQGVALVTRLVDIVWDIDQAALEVGDALKPGRLAIKSGYAQVEFFCGATMILEGPAELDLKSPMLARVRQGRLRAQVPPAARGFSLEVNELKVVDLGTEFGLSVSPEGANVHVFDGEVELHGADEEKQLLTAGQALVRTAAGGFEETVITPERFLDIAKLESRADGQRTARYERWKDWSDELRRDPRLIAYYAFDQHGGWERKLSNSVEPNNSELDGAIVGARRVSGRWAAKGGLEFKQPGDRVRVQIPGEYSSLTFTCWVRIDSLDRWYNSLFLTDNYNQGEPHWQILDTGQLFFSVRTRADDDDQGQDSRTPAHRKVLSPPFWKPSMSGKWLHLSTTYDVAAARTTHYLNGEVLHKEIIPEAQLVRMTRIGAASIGNWSWPTKPDAHFAIRNLNGSIDEFAMFAAALAADEVQEMYENGKP